MIRACAWCGNVIEGTSGEADQAVKFKLYEGSPVAWADFIQDKLCKKGDSGRGVRSLQRRLRALGYFDGECAASFGDRTERAVTLFQKENALPETGQADDATCRLLYSGRAKAVTDDGVLRAVRGGLESLVTPDAQGRPQMHLTLPDTAALDQLANALARLIGITQAAK